MFIALAELNLLLLLLVSGIVDFSEAELLVWELCVHLLLVSDSTIVQSSICLLPFFTSGHLPGKGAIFPYGCCFCCLLIDPPLLHLLPLLLLIGQKIGVSQISRRRCLMLATRTACLHGILTHVGKHLGKDGLGLVQRICRLIDLHLGLLGWRVLI